MADETKRTILHARKHYLQHWMGFYICSNDVPIKLTTDHEQEMDAAVCPQSEVRAVNSRCQKSTNGKGRLRN